MSYRIITYFKTLTLSSLCWFVFEMIKPSSNVDKEFCHSSFSNSVVQLWVVLHIDETIYKKEIKAKFYVKVDCFYMMYFNIFCTYVTWILHRWHLISHLSDDFCLFSNDRSFCVFFFWFSSFFFNFFSSL